MARHSRRVSFNPVMVPNRDHRRMVGLVAAQLYASWRDGDVRMSAPEAVKEAVAILDAVDAHFAPLDQVEAEKKMSQRTEYEKRREALQQKSDALDEEYAALRRECFGNDEDE